MKILKFISFLLISFLIFGCAGGSNPPKNEQNLTAANVKEPALEPVFNILIKSSKERLFLGEKERIFVPFELEVGGKFTGKAMPHGVDIQKQNKDGSKQIFARYALRLDDGATIYIENAGVIRKNEDGSRYFVTIPKFETYDAKYKWLEKRVFIGHAVATPRGTLLTFYEVK